MPPGNIQLGDQDKEWEKYRQGSYWDEAEKMPILVKLVMKAGLERRQAYYVLFGVLIVCTFITFQVIKRNFFPSASGAPTYIEDIPLEIQKTLPPEVLKQLPSRKTK